MSIEAKYDHYDISTNISTGGVADVGGAVTPTPQQPHFVIVSVSPTTVTVQPNQQFSVSVTVKNDGSAQGTANVRLIDPSGNVVDSKDVTLSAGEQTSVELSAKAPSNVGTYTYKVEVYNTSTNSVDDSTTITVNVKSAPPAPTPTISKKPIWLFLLLLLILAVIAYVLSRK